MAAKGNYQTALIERKGRVKTAGKVCSAFWKRGSPTPGKGAKHK